MSIFGFAWYYVAVFLIVLTVLVFVHEWGHYWVARRSGVRIEVFSIGFGPEIWGRTDAAGTRWKISAIPLGGYVKMFGEPEGGPEGSSETGDGREPRPMTPEEKAVSFNHKTLLQRSAIVLAGPMANFIFAVIVVGLLTAIIGTPRPMSAVGEVQEGSPAAAAQLQAGDRIVAIDGEDIEWFGDLRDRVAASPGQPLALSIQRGDETLTVTVTPAAAEDDDGNRIGRLGVRFDPNMVGYEETGVFAAAWSGVQYTVSTIIQIFDVLGQMFSGERSTEDLGGPIRIAQLSGDIAQGGAINLIMFMAALSINLGLINLFPIPVLDGGRLVFYMFEAVMGRPLGERAEEYGLRFGLLLVLILVVFVTWNDLRHLKVFDFIRDLIT